jgi:xanthine/CO dehydrogenase XdhC/CoxF family maturation factor
MPRKPRAPRRSLDRRTLQIAERLHHLAGVTSGPDATFEHQQEIAAAVVAEVLAGLWKDDPEPAAGTSERGAGA